MRSLLLIAAIGLAGCSTAPDQPRHSPRSEAKLQQYLGGKVAGKAQSCLSTLRSQEMIRVDDDTVLFRDGANRVYRNELAGTCNGLGSGNYTLVTSGIGGSGQLCRGDIARMVDLSTGIHAGSCVIGDFVPYTRPNS